MIQNHLQRVIQIAEIVGRQVVGHVVPHHRLGIHAEPHVIESHRLNQRYIIGSHPAYEMFFRVSLGIVNLRKPFAQVDAVSQMRCTALRNGVGLTETGARNKHD